MAPTPFVFTFKAFETIINNGWRGSEVAFAPKEPAAQGSIPCLHCLEQFTEAGDHLSNPSALASGTLELPKTITLAELDIFETSIER